MKAGHGPVVVAQAVVHEFCQPSGRLWKVPEVPILMGVDIDTKASALADLVTAVLQTPGATEGAARADAFFGRQTDEPWNAYVAKVRDASFRVTTNDFEVMIAAGVSEDAILELTLAAALGAGQRRLEAGLQALSEGS